LLLLAFLSWKTLFTWTVRQFGRQFCWQMIGCSYVVLFVVGLVQLLDSRVLCMWFDDLIAGFMGW
jgi:hypothetical protein